MGRIETRVERPGSGDSVSGTGTNGFVAVWTGGSTLGASVTSTAELAHVAGVTSGIQGQLDLKAPIASPTFTGTVTAPLISGGVGGEIGLVATSLISAQVNGLGYFQIAEDAIDIGNADLYIYNAKGLYFPGNGEIGGGGSSKPGSISLENLTASRAVVTDGFKKLVSSATTATELGYVSGVTSAIQTQLNLKASTASLDAVEESLEDDIEAVEETIDTISRRFARNFIHNGAMAINQIVNHPSPTSTGDNHGCDRFFLRVSASGGIYTMSQNSSAPTRAEAGFTTSVCQKIDCTTTATPGTDQYCFLQQTIEGYDYAHLAGKQVVLSFWVKATKTGTYCVAIQTSVRNNSYVAEYTVNSADTWENKTVTLTLNPATEDSNFINDRGLLVKWVIVAGTNYHTTAGAWQVGDFLATSNQVNGADNTANNFHITLASLNIGTPTADFSLAGGNFAGEVAICQRYFEKSVELGNVPNALVTSPNRAYTLTTTKTRAQVHYKAYKRENPTITVYSPNTGTAAKFRNSTVAADIDATKSGNSYGFTAESVTAVTVGDDITFNWIADARFGS